MSSPNDILTYIKKERFYVAWIFEKHLLQSVVHLLPPFFGEMFYVLLNEYISINDLTYKVLLWDIQWSMPYNDGHKYTHT